MCPTTHSFPQIISEIHLRKILDHRFVFALVDFEKGSTTFRTTTARW
jgi:hypothetical protein